MQFDVCFFFQLLLQKSVLGGGREAEFCSLLLGFAVSHEQEFQVWTKNVFLENKVEFINATVLVGIVVVLSRTSATSSRV